MNEWVQKSIEIVNSPGYLDRLHEVYPVVRETERLIPAHVKGALREAYEGGDNTTLVKLLLRLDKFPIKDPYVAFLRKREEFVEYNPETVDRIAETLYSMGFEAMMGGAEEPKEFNRQIGTLFKKSLPSLGFPFVSAWGFEEFEGIAFLEGSEAQLMTFANTVLGCELDKGPDLLAKSGSSYVVGEAKFLTDYGGHQNAQFQDALRLLQAKEGSAIRIAVLDGVVWIKGRTKMFKTVSTLEETALSAVLLKDFLQSL